MHRTMPKAPPCIAPLTWSCAAHLDVDLRMARSRALGRSGRRYLRSRCHRRRVTGSPSNSPHRLQVHRVRRSLRTARGVTSSDRERSLMRCPLVLSNTCARSTRRSPPVLVSQPAAHSLRWPRHSPPCPRSSPVSRQLCRSWDSCTRASTRTRLRSVLGCTQRSPACRALRSRRCYCWHSR